MIILLKHLRQRWKYGAISIRHTYIQSGSFSEGIENIGELEVTRLIGECKESCDDILFQ